MDAHVHRQLTQWVQFQHLTLQPVAVAILVAEHGQHLGVRDLDAFLGEWLDGKHSGFEQIAAGPFQQPRIASLAEDRLVDLAGSLFLHHVGFDQFVADPHAEAGNRCILWQGEIEDTFKAALGPIHKRFLDHSASNLIADIDRHLVVPDGQRHISPVNIGHQRTDRVVSRCAVEPLQPQRRLLRVDLR